MQDLQYIQIETAPSPTAAVIWLHGLGANGHDFEPVIPELKLPSDLVVRFIFPHAPEMPVTINGGYVMPAWYDILEMNIDRKVDAVQLRASADAVEKLVEQQIEQGIDSQNIILAGFSQGGAVAYELALRYGKPLGGLLALSTYFATADDIEFSEANKSLPIQIMHGTRDPVVPEVLGQKANQLLRGKDYDVDYKTYPIEHNVSLPEILDIGVWLTKSLRHCEE
ncbi:dienelactone hydrolase family protein [Porticoccus sp. W117]|uniref:alpha/beta hydrolase n=1 Tax=Porticoccus sp. W117 TaxID=3054777 RepID=UPI002591A936|nr:alpha/beta fold hydrolase [Porticoccus sp. W117]MDM3871688.1 dienelactone hydrolase family protein [Porticoccus sp. W117]